MHFSCPLGEERKWERNAIPLELGGRSCVLLQRPGVVGGPRGRFGGERCVTSDLIVHGIPPNDPDMGLRFSDDVAWLLAFATLSEVQVSSWTFNKKTVHRGIHGTARVFRPPLNLGNGEQMKRYLEEVWPRFRRFKRQRKLREVIHYLLVADRDGQPVEVQLALLAIVLENLKSTWARAKRVPVKKGRFVRPNSWDGDSGSWVGFEELLRRMLSEVGMRPGLKRIVKARNEIVHEGLSKRGAERVSWYYEKCMGLVQEYLLTAR